MIVAENILCNKTHQYVLEKDKFFYVGITDYFLNKFGEILFIELPEVGNSFLKGEIFGNIQSAKASSELYMPIGGTVIEVNEAIVDNYDSLKEKSWLIKIESETAAVDSYDLLEYDDYLEEV